MIPMGSIGPGPTRDPNDPENENETFIQAFGWEIGISVIVLGIVFSVLGYTIYVEIKEKGFQGIPTLYAFP